MRVSHLLQAGEELLRDVRPALIARARLRDGEAARVHGHVVLDRVEHAVVRTDVDRLGSVDDGRVGAERRVGSGLGEVGPGGALRRTLDDGRDRMEDVGCPRGLRRLSIVEELGRGRPAGVEQEGDRLLGNRGGAAVDQRLQRGLVRPGVGVPPRRGDAGVRASATSRVVEEDPVARRRVQGGVHRPAGLGVDRVPVPPEIEVARVAGGDVRQERQRLSLDVDRVELPLPLEALEDLHVADEHLGAEHVHHRLGAGELARDDLSEGDVQRRQELPLVRAVERDAGRQVFPARVGR